MTLSEALRIIDADDDSPAGQDRELNAFQWLWDHGHAHVLGGRVLAHCEDLCRRGLIEPTAPVAVNRFLFDPLRLQTGSPSPIALGDTLYAMLGKVSMKPRKYLVDDSAATAIEYAILAAGISISILAVVGTLGTNLVTIFSTISSQLATAGF